MILEICGIGVAELGDRVRICAEIQRNGKEDQLWFEFEAVYEEALVTELCDGFLISLLPYCLRNGIDIHSKVQASREVLQNMEALAELLSAKSPDEYHYIKIHAPIYEGNAFADKRRGVLASGSCGVDALHTLLACERSKYFERPTHLVLNNTGSNEAGGQTSALLSGRIRLSREFANKNGYGFVFVDSNYSDFVDRLHYSVTHLYVNVSIGYLLAKGFKAYMVSSGFDVGQQFTFNGDPAHAEPVLISYLDAPYFRVTHVMGDFISRFDKVRELLNYPPAFDHLNVCFSSVENCGRCSKCRRVLMALEALGAVDKFSNVFNLENYAKERDRVFAELLLDHWRKDVFVEEMWPSFRVKLTVRHWVRALMLRLWICIISVRWLQWLNLHIRHRDLSGE